MASTFSFLNLFLILLFVAPHSLVVARLISQPESSMGFQYHDGPLLTGQLYLNLIWYGNFKPAQRAIITDFVASLSSPRPVARPAVASWWASLSKFYKNAKSIPSVLIGKQFFDDGCSLGKSLTRDQITALAATNGTGVNSISVVLTAPDVAVEGFCMSSCGSHGSYRVSKVSRAGYIWVGNSETQCPGQCAWPFHQPIYGPQGPALVAPNNDVGMDGMVMNLAGLLAGTVTNPFGNGYFQGPKVAPLEAASACPGVYGKGAYPGYAGELLVDSTSGASYNANGINGRKYLLPALFDPSTRTCSTLV